MRIIGKINTVKCRCGKLAGKKTSPRTNRRVCKNCYKNDCSNRPSKPVVVKIPKKSRRLKSTFEGLEHTKAEEYVNNNKRKATKAETRFKFLFGYLQIPYVFQHAISVKESDFFYIVDFYIPKYGLIVEIDGEYHDTTDQQWKDKQRDKYLTENGYKVIRMTNNKVYEIRKVSELREFLGL